MNTNIQVTHTRYAGFQVGPVRVGVTWDVQQNPLARLRRSMATTMRGAAIIARKSFRTARAVIVVTRRHVPAWLGAILTVCLFIPGPLDELLVLLVIGGMVGFKPVMRSDLASGIREAWMR